MTFQEYQTRNNIVGYLDAGISATGDTLIIKSEYQNLFPEITGGNPRPYLLTIEQLGVENKISKREIVRVIAKTANVLTIQRSAGYCPSSYDATDYTNTAFSFLAGDKVSMYVVAENDEDLKEEINRKAYDNEVVHIEGDEEIDGVKTLKEFPEKEGNLLPDKPEQFATKQYVDDNSGGGFNIIENCVYEKGLLKSFVGDGNLYELEYRFGRISKVVGNGVEYNITYSGWGKLIGVSFTEL